ncbi:hypothetical protein BACPLE_01560 [Phocaeicola plebeius DSM 17135]|uniref:Uncharacterized protein n=1 Tax=Phocaeicola plebeius (strain DSM 17135 / JCM 12973 / CCUG 54634 / M2) TaxID=484018 RepID=B5CXW4_PHOPM|nr:hypothetical protein BACPLE_01560 [Phocaeicola plebeius DSM 17135]
MSCILYLYIIVCKITVFQRKTGILCRVFIFFGVNAGEKAGLSEGESRRGAMKKILSFRVKKRCKTLVV